MASALGPSNKYFGLLGDNGSFCIHNGTYPDADYGMLWCATPGLSQHEMKARAPQTQRMLGAYPTDCTLRSWQGRGQDVHSVVADPLFKDPDNGDFSLDPSSPALALGFKPIDTSTIGPRPQA